MNKAITDGLTFTPPPFLDGLSVWSSEDGRPGQASYQSTGNATLVPADQDFAGCLELQKLSDVTKLRYTGDTPFVPGCYLQVTVRIKAVSGNLPSARIAAWPGTGADTHVLGLSEFGPEVPLTSYGQVVTLKAIIGSGLRTGVDMCWGMSPQFAHIGLDLTGSNGGVVRIDDIQIEDVTHVFHRNMMDWVDVRDFGAVGNGSIDDHAAFLAADAAANGRQVLVSNGTYHLAEHVTFTNPVRFEGTVTMPQDKRLSLTKNFDLPAYVDAFGSELEGFKRALATLFNFSDHDSLDMKGLRVNITEPIDVHSVVGNKDTYAIRKVIRNGLFSAESSSNWDTVTVTSQASYSTSTPTTLTNVVNVANVEVGSLVEGLGVGREVYVTAKNVGNGTLTLSSPLFDAVGTQIFTFKRFKYILDFSGFSYLARFVLSDIDFSCEGRASAVMLPSDGLIFHIRDCFFTRPMDRGITSIGTGCQGMLIDRCQFLSNEQSLPAQSRTTIGFNVNANDIKLRDNRAVRMKHFGILSGTGNLITGNHWFQDDNETNGLRTAGLILTRTNVKTTITANYVDNSFVEWTNEHDPEPDQNNELSFGGLTVSANVFTANGVAPFFRWFVIKPVGAGHFLHGFNMSGNSFKAINGNIERVDKIDTTYANLDLGRSRNVTVEGNSFSGIDQMIVNPATVKFDENSDQTVWTCSFAGYLPFGGFARRVASVMAEGAIRNAANAVVSTVPFAKVQQGAASDDITLASAEACHGRVLVTARMDEPV